MRVFAALVFAASSALAYEVTYPSETQGWTTSGTNTLSWTRVDTDPTTFTAVLINQQLSYVQILDSDVDGTTGSISLSAPSGGWPTGSPFQVNLAHDPQHLDTLLAQSPQFSITSSGSSSSSSSSSSSASSPGSSGSPGTSGSPGSSTSSGTGTSSRSPTSTLSGGTSTSSDTSTSPTASSAGFLAASAQAGLLTAVAALTALITTVF